MLRSALLIASVASSAFAAVANVCAQHPYNQMQGYRDYGPAKEHCAAHYPVHTVTKVVYPKCLTTTHHAIVRTETVTHTRTYHCQSPHPKPYPPDQSVYPVPTYGHPGGYGKPPGYGSPPGYGYGHKARDAAPEPTSNAKRDDSWKAHEWSQYKAAIAKCGYDCIQNACKCIAEVKTVTHTHRPDCTKTVQKHIVATHTDIVTEGYKCAGYGGRADGSRVHHAVNGGPLYGGAVNGGPKYGGAKDYHGPPHHYPAPHPYGYGH